MWWSTTLTDTIMGNGQSYYYLEDAETRNPVSLSAPELGFNFTTLSFTPMDADVATMQQFLEWWPQCGNGKLEGSPKDPLKDIESVGKSRRRSKL